MVRTWCLVLAVGVFAAPAFAQTPAMPYAGEQTRAIKSLSEDEIATLLKGEGMGLAKAAELNGYPGPAHVLGVAKELDLSDAQHRRVQAIFDRMHATAVSLGSQIIARERVLDQLLAKGEMTPRHLADETAQIAALQGRLRAAHLAAHLETRPLLTPEQISTYQRLRGYGSPDGHHAHPG